MYAMTMLGLHQLLLSYRVPPPGVLTFLFRVTTKGDTSVIVFEMNSHAKLVRCIVLFQRGFHISGQNSTQFISFGFLF